jgi:hypothetical protein
LERTLHFVILANVSGDDEANANDLPFASRGSIIEAAMSPDAKSAVESPVPNPPVEHEPNLLRFGLRQWFYFISGIVVLCALFASLEGKGAIVLASVVALIVAHVFGTFLGTRLRDTSGEVVRWKARPGSADADQPVSLPQPVSLADVRLPETTSLAGHSDGSRRSRWALGFGALVGFGLGAWGIHELAGSTVTWSGLAFGAVSCGVMGAWIVLLVSNFWAIARQALRHASREE